MVTEAAPRLRLDAIVLAAGFGSRFGGAKLTAPWRGGRLIDGALRAALAAPALGVVVVTGADASVESAVVEFVRQGPEAKRVRMVHAADHGLGMSASLATGVAALPSDCEGVFVFLGDMPLIPPDIPAALAKALASGANAAAPSFDGQRGHPVLFGRDLFPALARLTGDEGARGVLRGLSDKLAIVPATDPGVLLDVDAPGDLDALG